MIERSPKETRAAATGGLTQSIVASPKEFSSITAGKVVVHKQNLAQVMCSIHRTLGLLHQLYLTVSSFNVASPLLQRLNNLVLELDNVAKLVDQGNIQVLMEVLNMIDDGRNPDELTWDVLNDCIAKNQVAKGKAYAFKELDEVFPDEVEAYREIRAASEAEMKRFAQVQSLVLNGDMKVKTKI